MLTPPRDRKIIHEAMKLPGCPRRTEEGKYRVEEWQKFVNDNFASISRDMSPDKVKLEMEKLKLQNEKLSFELRIKRKDYTENVVVEQWVGQMILAAKHDLLRLPGKLAQQIIGLTEVEAEKLLRTEINAALAQLTARPLYAANDSLI